MPISIRLLFLSHSLSPSLLMTAAFSLHSPEFDLLFCIVPLYSSFLFQFLLHFLYCFMLKMSETRIRPRQVLILIIIFLIMLLMVHRNGQRTCQGPAVLKNLYERSLVSPLITIYAVTPTYARPQQQAELTRYDDWKLIISIAKANSSTMIQHTPCSHLSI